MLFNYSARDTLGKVCEGVVNAVGRDDVVSRLQKEGLQVTTPDVEAFRKTVQAAYQNSDYAKIWPKGLVERINAVK